MDRVTSLTNSTKLYAFLLKLRPIHSGTLMPFTGRQVHGTFLHWLQTIAPEVAIWLHEGNKRRLFTCSSLQFPLPLSRILEAERKNIHLPLDPDMSYHVRFTILLNELFPLFYEALVPSYITATDSKKSRFIQIGKQPFLLEEVLIEKNHPSGWTGFTSLRELVEQVKTRQLGSSETITIEFASLTTFNLSNSHHKPYGPYYALLPLPLYVFLSLMRRWEDLAPSELVSIVQRDRIEQYIQDDGIILVDYDLKTHVVHFPTHQQQGFVGRCTYALRGPDESTTTATPLTLRKQLLLLSQIAFYSGVGYKTAMGLGQARVV